MTRKHIGVPRRMTLRLDKPPTRCLVEGPVRLDNKSRLPRLFMEAYDTRITEESMGIAVTTDGEKIVNAEKVLKDARAEEVKRGVEGE